MSGWSTVTPSTGRGDKTKLEDLIEIHKLPPKRKERVRPIGPIVSFVRFWISILVDDKNSKVKGKKKVISIAKYCLDHDPVKGEFVRAICPYRKAFESGEYNYKIIGADGKEKPVIQMDRKYLANFLVRSIQENEPKKVPKHSRKELKETTILGHKGFWKEPSSESWTPVKAIQIANTMAIKLKSVTDQNKRTVKVKGGKEKKVFELSHPKYGMDVDLYYDPDQSGTGMYDATVILADDEDDDPRKPLTDEEMGYLLQNLDIIPSQTESIEDAKKEWKHLEERIVPDPSGDGKSSKKKAKSSSILDADEDDEDEDDEPKAKKSKKDKTSAKKSSKKAKPADDDDDDDLDLEDIEDLDADDEPKAKKKTKSSSKSSSSKSSKVTKLADKKKSKTGGKDLKAKKKLKKAA